MESKEKSFVDLANTFNDEVTRVTDIQNNGGVLTPPTQIPLVEDEDLRASFAALGFGKINFSAVRIFYRALFSIKGDPRQIAHYFPSGESICLAAFAFNEGGLPITKDFFLSHQVVRLLQVSPEGITVGFPGKKGYFFNLLPNTVRQTCVLVAPEYQNPYLPNRTEIEALEKSFFETLDNLENCLNS